MHDRATGLLLSSVLGLSLALFFALPFVPGAGTAPIVTAAILLAAATAPLHWGVLHESIHGKLGSSDAQNRFFGRATGWCLGYSWDALRFAHLAHHRFNRHGLDRPEELLEGDSRLVKSAFYYFQLLGGHAIGSVLIGFAFFLPQSFSVWLLGNLGCDADVTPVTRAALVYYTNAERRARIRMDCAASIALFGAAIWAWGVNWPVFAGIIGARWVMLSLVENSPHYGTGRDSDTYARNTRWPRALGWLLMNHNYHGIHHEKPDLGWQDLPEQFARQGAAFEGGWFACVMAQFRGLRRLSGEFPLPAQPS